MARKNEPTHEPFGRKFFGDLFGGSNHTPREEKVLEYVIHRIENGAHLRDVLEEDYVRRNCSQGEIDEIENDPRLVHAARKSMEHVFSSGDLDPTAVFSVVDPHA
ncbi:hypothetical protein BH24ACT22_BH24ACT22_00890 [soil metagenome]